MTDLARWLDDRRPAIPAELRRAVDAVLEAPVPGRGSGAVEVAGAGRALTEGDVADVLADSALAALRRVATAASDRSTAPELLAADALLTYACEAAAEAGPERLDRLTASLDVERFSVLLGAHNS